MNDISLPAYLRKLARETALDTERQLIGYLVGLVDGEGRAHRFKAFERATGNSRQAMFNWVMGRSSPKLINFIMALHWLGYELRIVKRGAP